MKHVLNTEKILFKDMTPEERGVIVEAWLKDEVEYAEDWRESVGEWKTKTSTSKLSPNSIYRTKPKQLNIPWEYIKPEYKWAAMDADGLLFFYEKLPVSCLEDKVWDSAGLTCENPLNINTDGIDWKDSLIQRPEGV